MVLTWQNSLRQEETHVRITLVSIHVEDQDRALAFYRDVLGFVPKVDIPLGPTAG